MFTPRGLVTGFLMGVRQYRTGASWTWVRKRRRGAVFSTGLEQPIPFKMLNFFQQLQESLERQTGHALARHPHMTDAPAL
ncbi:MAG: hypothetical protein WBB13_15025 [Tabrizicola sp.]